MREPKIVADKIDQGPYKPRFLEGIDKEEVWFYRDDHGNIEVHVSLTRAPHISFVIPRKREAPR